MPSRNLHSKPFSKEQIKRAVSHALSSPEHILFDEPTGEVVSGHGESLANMTVLLDVTRMMNSTVELSSLFSLVMDLSKRL